MMKKFGKLLLAMVIGISLFGCTSEPQLSDEEKLLITTNETTQERSSFLTTMQDEGYEYNYYTKDDSLVLEKGEVYFCMIPNSDKSKDILKFGDKDGEYTYETDVDSKSPTLINLADILTKHNTNLANIEYEFSSALSKRRFELKQEKLNEKYPTRKKLLDAGYILTGYAKDEKGENTISSTWTDSVKEDGETVDIFIDVIEKQFSKHYGGSTKVKYVYSWGDKTATISGGPTALKYDFNKKKIITSVGLDTKNETLYLTQAFYIEQEFNKELKRIGVTIQDLVMPEDNL